MNSILYKSFDSSQFLFEILWREFPNIKTTKEADKIINKLIITSKEFCDLHDKKIFRMKIQNQGGFGDVGAFTIENKPVKSIVFSFERTGEKNNMFLCEMIAKIGKQNNPNKIYRLDFSTIAITDPLSDMVFGSMLGHLYDIGVNPFVTKYFGSYICDNNNTAMFIEKSTKELREKLNRNLKNRISPPEFKNLLMQFVYCMYILKVYYGVVHFDSHLRNIMVTDLRDNEYMYHGLEFSKLKYILFETGIKDRNNVPIVVAIKKTNYLLKLIDYGCMMACFDRSEFSKFRRDLRIETNVTEIYNIGASEAVEISRKNKSYANTVDILFSLINIHEYLRIGLENSELLVPDPTAVIENREYLNIINNLSVSLFNFNMTDYVMSNPQYQPKRKGDGTYIWFMNNHSTGIERGFEDPKYLMKALITSCTSSSLENSFPFEKTKYFKKPVNVSYFENINEPITTENSIFLTHNISDYNKMFNRFEKIVDYTEKCEAFNEKYCEVVKLYNQEPYETFKDEKLVEENKNVKIIVKTSSLNANPTYKNYNSWLNANKVPIEKLQKHLEDVKIHMIEIKEYKNITVTSNDPMINTPGISIPMGNDAVFSNKVKPLGYFANTDPFEITNHLYPRDYNKYLGILSFGTDKKLYLEKYNDFLNRHETTFKEHMINVTEKEQVEYINYPVKLKSGSQYNWAVTLGPVLVWDSNVIFTEQVMLKSKSQSVLYGNSDNRLFIGSGPGYYSMTDSGEIQSQLVYIERNNHKGFMLIEGGGFMLQGLDKINLAIMCRNLGMQRAVCVSSGYSANILMKNIKNEKTDENKTYISKSPLRVTYGAVMHCHW